MKDIWDVPEELRGIYAHAHGALAGSRLLFISGQFGVAPDGWLAADFITQAAQAMTNVETLLARAAMTKSDLVKVTYYVTLARDLPTLAEIRRRRWGHAEPPAVTVVVVAALARPEYVVEIEATAASL